MHRGRKPGTISNRLLFRIDCIEPTICRSPRESDSDPTLAILGAAFVLCFAAYLILRSAPASLPVKAIVVGGAILFRLTLLPAGLPPDLPFGEKLAAMAADWRVFLTA